MKKCAFIIGPESSGTRLLKKHFIASGWQGSEGHREMWSLDSLPENPAARIVWRRSLPMAKVWWDVKMYFHRITQQGFDLNVYVTTRDWKCMAASQRKHHKGGPRRIREAYMTIFDALANVDNWRLVSYESLIQYGGRVVGLNKLATYDANMKYYGNSYEGGDGSRGRK